jgi:hypothetical protein
MQPCIRCSVSVHYGTAAGSSVAGSWIRRFACVLGVALVLMAARPSAAQISIPHLGGGDPLADAKEKIQEDLFVKTATKLLGDQLPIDLDASKTYPTVDVLPGAAFAPRPLAFTPNTLNNPLPPGDYTVNVMAFCTEYSVHRPGAGVAYKLAPLEGKQAGAVATLLWRGVQAGVDPQHLMGVAWGIQSGLTYDRMPKTFQATIDSLIHDYKSQLNGDFIQQLEDAYQAVAKEAKLPPLDALLLKMGDAGRLALAAEVERNALLATDKSDELREQTLFAGQENGVYTPVKAEDGPWTVRIPGVAYMRYRIVGGNLHDDNVIEIRIVGQPPNQADSPMAARVVDASFAPASGDATASPQTPTLMALMGAQQAANSAIVAAGLIGYSVGQGAQALIPIPPRPMDCPMTPAPGDIVLYLDANGGYIHVARITPNGVQMNPDGTATVTQVISKWGEFGVYEHDPDDTNYGKNWTVWHSPLPGDHSLSLDNGHLYTVKQTQIMSCADSFCTPYQLVTPEQAESQINAQCKGLYSHLIVDPAHPPSPAYDCRGYVFFYGRVGIPDTYLFWNQVDEILRDYQYCPVPAKHTGGHSCEP